MRVLLTTSPEAGWSPFWLGEKRPPLGLWSLVSVLRDAGHQVEFVDPYLDDSHVPNLDSFDAIGIYSSTVVFNGTLRILSEVYAQKQRGWKGLTLVGGPHTTVRPETIPEWVDYVVQGEGEHAILQALERTAPSRLFRGERIVDLDSLPRPAYDLFAGRGYVDRFPQETRVMVSPVYTVNTSRGCPYACTFCSAKTIWGRRWTGQSAERILADTEWLEREHGAAGFYFREDEFTVNTKRVVALCEGLLARGSTLPWMAEARVNHLQDAEFVALLARSGCIALYIGVESGSQRMLDEVFHKGITVEQTVVAFENCRANGILTMASFIKGTGLETPADDEATRALIARIRPTNVWMNQFTGVPTSELYERLKTEGRFDRIDDLGLLYPKANQ